MDHFAGLDVSVKETSVCIVDDSGKIVREVKVASEPEALLAVLKSPAYRFKRIGLEAGPLSQWLFSALAGAELPVVCVETRHMQALLKAQINKTDRNDARGIAQMMRVGLYRPLDQLELTLEQIKSVETERDAMLSQSDEGTPAPGAMLKSLKGIGPEFAGVLWSEDCSEAFPTDGRLPLMPDWRRRRGGADPSLMNKASPKPETRGCEQP